MSDYDSPWKEAMDRFFADFLAFFFPLVHALLDWRRDYESLDTELRKIAPEAEGGKRFIDKLVKAWKVTGDTRLVHVEVQCQPQEGFEHRMHTYNLHIEAVYHHPVLTLVVLGDESEAWRPAEYVYEEAGCRRTLCFPPVKLLDYVNRLEELERHENPFGMMVAAHLTAQRTRGDVEARKVVKLRLLRGLYGRRMDAADAREWAKYIDWLLDLPREENQQVWQEMHAIEEERKMPFVTSFEKIGYERGKEEGRLEELYNGIELGLELKFGIDGLALMPEVRQKQDVALLSAIRNAIKSAANLDDIRRLLA
jgi:hypothetical protein